MIDNKALVYALMFARERYNTDNKTLRNSLFAYSVGGRSLIFSCLIEKAAARCKDDDDDHPRAAADWSTWFVDGRETADEALKRLTTSAPAGRATRNL